MEMYTYLIGVGRADITDSAIGNGMQGMADPDQKVQDVETLLYARAFLVKDPSGTSVTILNADIWAGTAALKTEVLSRLEKETPGVFTEANVLISGTHTHSAPGGYSDWSLYESVPGGFDPHTFECIVHGMVTAIQKAQRTLAPGKIFVKSGHVPDCGRQRSQLAFENNKEFKENSKIKSTDDDMLLLKFVHTAGGVEKPIGILNWYAIHPTDMGQLNRSITGDNKGYASELFEQEMKKDGLSGFVAAFANANCGDVSGNVEYGRIPNGIDDHAHMKAHGTKQYAEALRLFQATKAEDELTGPIGFCHTRKKMPDIVLEG